MLDCRSIAALLALTLAPLAGAQTLPDGDGEPVAESEAPPEYQIEVIVFAHRDFNPNEEDFEHEREPIEPPTGDLVAAGLPPSLVQRRETPAQPELAAPDPAPTGGELGGIEDADHPSSIP